MGAFLLIFTTYCQICFGSFISGSSGGGAVDSVNGQTGVVSLTTSDVSEGTGKYFTPGRAIASALSGFSAAPGSVADTDTVLQAIQKIVGNYNNSLVYQNVSDFINVGGSAVGDPLTGNHGYLFVGTDPRIGTYQISVGAAAGVGFIDINGLTWGWYHSWGVDPPGQINMIADDGGTRVRMNTDTGDLGIDGELVVSTSETPSSSVAGCEPGRISWDGSFLYVCIAENTWKRAAISNW